MFGSGSCQPFRSRYNCRVESRILFITGTDTGVGKTVVTALLARYLRERGVRVAALKPMCSGDRGDARILWEAMGKTLALAEVNPWHLRAPLAPLLAARKERKRVSLPSVVQHVRSMAGQHEVTLVEGAGGLLSPLGEGFDSRDLIREVDALPLVVAPNHLGVINQVRLTIEALPRLCRSHVVLISPVRANAASRTNDVLLGEFLRRDSIHVLRWQKEGAGQGMNRRLRETLGALLHSLHG